MTTLQPLTQARTSTPTLKPSTPHPFVITNKVIQDRATFLQRTDGQGSPTVIEIELAPQGGNTPHIHTSYDETFTPVRGTLGVNLGGKKVLLTPGQQATVRAGTVHNFFNPTEETVVFRIELTPGHRGFEQGLILIYGLANDDQTDSKSVPKNPLYTALILDISDMRLPGMMRLMTPVFRLLATVARWQGVEKKLLETYSA